MNFNRCQVAYNPTKSCGIILCHRFSKTPLSLVIMTRLAHDGKQIVATCIVFVILDTAAVALRILAKSQTKARFAADDAWIVAALLVYSAFIGVLVNSE